MTDITYLATQQGWACLSRIKNLFDGFILAHEVGTENSPRLVLSTFRQAKEKQKVSADLLLHSDQGFQYTGHGYHTLLQELAITPSMSRRGNCWDNAVRENFFSHLKEEALQQVRNPSLNELRHIIDDYIHFYNYEPIQLKTRQTPSNSGACPFSHRGLSLFLSVFRGTVQSEASF